MKIYTKTGDDGTSQLFNGQRLPKDDPVFHALGDVDELNCAVGAAREFCKDVAGVQELVGQLETIQSRLLDVGSSVATPANSHTPEAKLARASFDPENITTVEGWIDGMAEELRALRHFILPSGGRAGALLHLARAVARRAERTLVTLHRASASAEGQACLEPAVLIYVNRISDYLFTAARYVSMIEGHEEVTYCKPAAAPAKGAKPT